MNEIKPLIKFDDFSKIDIRIGTVVSAEEIEGSEKLLKLIVDFGDIGQKQILSGVKEWYSPDDLVEKQLPFIVNIEPRKMMGLESQGMILAVDSDDKAVIFFLDESVENGAPIR